jgi:hypothetical protein
MREAATSKERDTGPPNRNFLMASSDDQRGPAAQKVFSPLAYDNLTRNIVDELMRRGPFALPLRERFTGAGVYALFYVGDDKNYEPIRSPEASNPIYVGKAVPRGARKGAMGDLTVSAQLYDRLSEHADSIAAASNLRHEDFLCRYLAVEPLWIVMAEQFLITRFRPLWNLELDGFGNHDPGSGRYEGEIAWWDARHPGRPWAAKLRQTRTLDDAKARVQAFFERLYVAPSEVEAEAKRVASEKAESDE